MAPGAYAQPVASVGQTPGDPHEAMNRRFYAMFQSTDRQYLRPLVGLYHALTPGLIGKAVHNLVTAMSEPVVIINDVLQGRIKSAARDVARLAGNATFGLAATIDVAGKHGLPHHDNDFGITLGVWGVKSGPYFFLPFLGPTTVRDAIGMAADAGMNPLNFMRFPGRVTLEYSSAVVGGLDKRLVAGPQLDALTQDATDPYATLRSVYLQSREAEIRGEDAAPDLAPIDDPGPASAPPPGPSSQAEPPSLPAIVSPPSATAAYATADADLDAPIATARQIDLGGSAMRLAGN
ncbi:MAG TPA: VacJ family lipoprotein [Caulobacteraceae bacterium]